MAIADTVFVNGKVVTVDKKFSIKEAVAVKNGWIIDVGANSDMNQYLGSKTEVIDLKGKIIMPAAHDAHAHGIVWGANALFTCDCSPSSVRSSADLQRVLAEKAKNARPGEWIRGGGINYNTFTDADPAGLSRKLIDDVTPDNPVLIVDWSGHNVLVNSKALKICGVDRNTPDPEHGKVFRDANGELTGIFAEGAIDLITKKVPLWTDEEIRDAIIGLQKNLNRMGYASYTESTLGPGGNFRDSGSSGERGIGIYKKLHEDGLLTARVSVGLYTGVNSVQSYEYMRNDLEAMKLPEITDENWFNIPMIKIFADGVYLDYTSWLIDDYSDRPGHHGKSCFEGTDEEQAAELKKMIMLAHQKGYQVGIHTIGDRAVQNSLDGIIEAMTEFPGKTRRHYLIHAESMATDEMADKMARFGIPISVQPGLGTSLYEVSLSRLGEERGRKVFGLKRLLDKGLVLAGGSDSLGGPYCSWLQSVQAAVTRRSTVTGQVFAPELTISVKDGIRLFTCNGAYQESFENVRGSIEVGKVADFQVLDQDIFSVNPEEIGKIEIVLTMVDGKVVYCK